MPVLKSSQLAWLVSLPFFYSIFFSLWGIGILEYYCFKNTSLLFFFLSQICYPLLIFLVYSFWIVWYYWEDSMDALFNRTFAAIMFGIIIWILIGSGIAY